MYVGMVRAKVWCGACVFVCLFVCLFGTQDGRGGGVGIIPEGIFDLFLEGGGGGVACIAGGFSSSAQKTASYVG